MRKYWIVCLVLALITTLAGFAVATRHQTQTTAQARLAIGSQSLSNYQVAGFAEASEELAADYARYVNNSATTQSVLTKALGDRVSELTGIDASPIPQSDVVVVEATATDPQVASIATQAIAEQLHQQTATATKASTGTKLLAEYHAVAVRVVKARHLAQSLHGSGAAAVNAEAKVQLLTAKQNALGIAYQQSLTSPPSQSELNLIQDAAVTSNDRTQTRELYAVSGLLAGLILGLVVSTILGRRSQREPARNKGTSPARSNQALPI
jgi:hypothetical protein